MKEIDEMLNQWIHNSIIKEKLRELIIKEIDYNQDIKSVLWEYIYERDFNEVNRKIRKIENEKV